MLKTQSEITSQEIAKEIQLAGQQGDYDNALQTFKNAIKQHGDCTNIYNNMIKVASDFDQLDIALGVYRLAVKKSVTNLLTHSNIIDAAGKATNTLIVREAYQITLRLNQLRPDRSCRDFINKLLKAARDCHDFDTALHAYTKIGPHADVITHTTMMTIAARHGDIDLFESAFDKARGLCQGESLERTIATHNALQKTLLKKVSTYKMSPLTLAPSYNSLPILDRLHQESPPTLKLSTEEKQSPSTNAIKQAYLHAVKFNFADHKKMLLNAGSVGDIELALIAYMNGLNDSGDKSDLHLCMMRVAGQNNRMDLVETARQNAIKAHVNPQEIAKAYSEATGVHTMVSQSDTSSIPTQSDTEKCDYLSLSY